ncbi:MAG: ABC transporter permease [Oscillospiraceae bacterium]|jgi:peptide/nickel transport system permease protein|nr:ABC transporter permease [Oscillospiraceae bacterium]
MRNYIIKRVLLSIVILFCVAFIVYVIMRSLPTSYVERQAGIKAMTPGSTRTYEEWMDLLNARYGLDKAVLPGYLTWAKDAVRGDFGESWAWNMLCTDKFKDVIWYSFALGAFSLLFQMLIAIPLGILAARKQYSRTDYTVTVVALVGISMPSFFFAALLKLTLSGQLGWFELYGMVSRTHQFMTPFQQFLDIAWHYVMPLMTLTFISIGGWMRYVRTNMLEVLNSDYIRTARAKGLPEKRVVNHHAFRNTLIPIVTIFGGTLPGLFSGALVTEQLFQIVGIGYTGYQSLIQGDIPFVMFYMTFMAVLVLAGTLLADILYAVVDPRVRVA